MKKDSTIASDRSSETSRERILRTAAQLFREKGYAATTVRDLAKAVGVQSGSLFYHFASKEELLRAVMEEGIKGAIQAAKRALDAHDTPREKLLSLFQAHLEALLGGEHEIWAVVLYEWRSLSPGSRSRLVALRDAYEMLWQETLHEAARYGLVPGDTHLFRRYILGALNWTFEWFHTEGELDIHTLAEKFLEFTLAFRSGGPTRR